MRQQCGNRERRKTFKLSKRNGNPAELTFQNNSYISFQSHLSSGLKLEYGCVEDVAKMQFIFYSHSSSCVKSIMFGTCMLFITYLETISSNTVFSTRPHIINLITNCAAVPINYDSMTNQHAVIGQCNSILIFNTKEEDILDSIKILTNKKYLCMSGNSANLIIHQADRKM